MPRKEGNKDDKDNKDNRDFGEGQGQERSTTTEEIKSLEQISFCPVFYPSEQEFLNFTSYIEKCVSQIGDIGIFKVSFWLYFLYLLFQVVPPNDYVARKVGYENLKLKIKKPVEQNVQATGQKGIYELTLIERVSRSIEKLKKDSKKLDQLVTN